MSFRTVIVSRQSKLSYKNRYLVVKNEIGENYIHLSEIDTVIVDSLAVSITCYLLKELAQNKINIIFCNEEHNPFGELYPLYSSYNSSKKIIMQSKWPNKNKDILWKLIVQNKIKNQASLINKLVDNDDNLILSYVDEVTDGDKTNREGHAAKVYFNKLFGKKFSRDSQNEINSALNYGYGVLLSMVNKEVTSLGYLTQLGIHHKNEFNPYNLSCDLMEIFRPIIDNFVYFNQERKLDSYYKYDIVNIFNSKFKYDYKEYYLKDIIKMYVKNSIDSLENITRYKEFCYYEE